MIKIKKGLNLPITGQPQPMIENVSVKHVAVLGDDYVGMKPTMLVREGRFFVRTGQALFEDKKNPGVLYTAPASGKVTVINRGERRVLQSVVIAVSGQDHADFPRYAESELRTSGAEKAEELLVKSGLWVSFRTRPFSKAPALGQRPRSIFVTAMDTNPLAADPSVVLRGQETYFNQGLMVLTQLTKGSVYVCKGPGTQISTPDPPQLEFETFSGPHPAGLPGTHIHFLDPVGLNKTVWTIDYQDVIAIGSLFTTGKLKTDRVVSFAGPAVKDPKHFRVPMGASIAEVAQSRCKPDLKFVSSPAPSSRAAKQMDLHAYLGRFHRQICALEEGRKRELLGWQGPGFDKFSVKRTFAAFGLLRSGNLILQPRLAAASAPWCLSGVTKRSCHWIWSRLSSALSHLWRH